MSVAADPKACDAPASAERLHLELPADAVARLLAEGRLRACDFRCLDCASKACVRRLLLSNSARRAITATVRHP